MKEVKLDKKEIELLVGLLSDNDSKLAINLRKRLLKATKPIKVSSAKSKGRTLQYTVCEDIAELLGINFNQQDDNCLIHSREMGLNGTDVVLRGKAKELFPYSIECKACETLAIPKWIEQAKSNIQDNTDWMLIVKKQSIGKPICIVDWENFKNIFKKLLHIS